jgi:tetratricopeptide (TPR) repeat protein
LRGFETVLGPWDDDSPICKAFRLARDFVRIYGASQPGVVARLAQVFYKKVAEDGTEAEVHFYRNAFAAPADDPLLNRLHGLSAERAESTTFAIEGWLRYESDIESLPERFPGTTGTLARALVWEHIAALVRVAATVYKLPKEVPPADQCYRNSMALVPSRLHPYERLLDELKKAPNKKKQALAAAQSLVAKFPNHAATWEFLGDSLFAGKKPADAMEAYRAALQANPMHGDLRRKLADAVWAKGIKLATAPPRAKAGPKPEKYRPTLEEALRFTEGSPTARLAHWAILEFRHGHADFARELLAKAESVPHSRIALPLALHAASLFEKKLADEIRQEFEARWQRSLEQEANPIETLAVLEVLLLFDSKALRGKKQIVAEVLPELTKKGLESYSEDQLLKLGQRLLDLKLNPSAKKVAEQAGRRYPDNPFVQLLLCDTALGSPGGNRMRGVNWKARAALDKASKLALALPRELQERALKEIQKREELVQPDDDFRDGLMGFFNRFMDPFGDDDFDDEDLDDDDFGGW